MMFGDAIKIMVSGEGDTYQAIQVIESAVLGASEYGDPDHSLNDWIAAGQYQLTDTPESIAAEWDSDRE